MESNLEPRQTFIGQPKRPHSRTIPTESWERHKEVILHKYARMTMKKLKESMEIEYGFCPTLDQYKRRFRRWKVQKSHGVISWPSGSMSSPSVVEAPSPWSRASNKTVTLPEDTDRVHSTSSIELSVPSTSSPYGPPSVFFEEREPVLDGKEDPSRSLNVNDTGSTFPNQWSVKELESKAVLGARTSNNSNKSASESPTTLPSQPPEVTLTASIGSSSRSWASFERVGDRLQETTRLSASPPEVGISAIDEEVEALSDELGIFSINATEYEGQDDDWTILWTENPY